MAAFIVLTRLSYQALNSWRSLADLSGEIMKRIRDAYAGVELTATYVVLDCGALAGYVDIFTAPDIETATKVAAIIRTYGHATTEIWPATEWDKAQCGHRRIDTPLSGGQPQGWHGRASGAASLP